MVKKEFLGNKSDVSETYIYILNMIDNDKSLRKFNIKNLYPGQTVI